MTPAPSPIPQDYERVTLPDGSQLVARCFGNANARAAVMLPGAMGVPQKFYEAYAKWLAAQGCFAVTFDYRGTGLSSPRNLRGESLRQCKVNIGDWAEHDCAAIINLICTRTNNAPLFVVGHSLGGQIIGMIPNRDRLAGAFIVASGSGYWRETSPPTRRNSKWLWFFLAPVLTPLFGYFPGRLLRAVGDLPRGVIEQWRRWCLNPHYLVGAEGPSMAAQYASVTLPMLVLSFTDDEMMSAANTEALCNFYPHATIERKRLTPSDIGAQRIGHFGFFRSQFSTTLWPLTTQWLASLLAK